MFFISNPGNGKLALLKLLNLLENTTYSLTDVEFSLPEINVEASPIRNTKVTAHFLGTKGFYGKKLIVYNRIHIDELPVLTVLRGLATTYYELIPVLNSTYNLRLSMDDIIDGPLPDIVSEEIVVTIPFSPNSYLYYSTPEVVTVGSPPVYSLDKPSDVFNKYICVGLDQYKEYHMVNGDRYQTLHQANSYACGYEDGSVRIQVTVPLEMDFYIGDPSEVFTIELKNGVADVTATLVLPSGLTASQTVFPLTVAQPSATFTVSSAQAGNYQLTFTNNGGVIDPSPIDVIAKQLTAAAITIIPPVNTTVHPNQPSGAYTIVASDLDEPITVTVSVTAGATISNDVFVLTPVDNQATFTLQSPTEASYTLSFTNDLGILNPSNVVVMVTSAVVITFTAPPTPYNPDIQTGFFNVTMSQSSVPVTITPETTGGGVIVPTSLNLTPAAPTAGFKITYNTVGDKTVSLTNSVGGANPAPKQITVVEPYVTITAPVTTIVAGSISDAFTMTLVDSAANKTIDINTDAGTVYNSSNVEDYSYLLTPAQPTATFKLEYTEAFFGPGYVQGISYGQLNVDPTVNFNVDNTATLDIVVPATINTNEPYLMSLTRTSSVGQWTYEFDAIASILYLGADVNNQIVFVDGELTKSIYFVNTGNIAVVAYGAGTIVEMNKIVAGQLRTAVDLLRDSLFHKTQLLLRPNANNDYADKSVNNLNVSTSAVSTVNTAGIRRWSANDYVVSFANDPFIDYGYTPAIDIAGKDFCIEGIHKLNVNTTTLRNLIDFRGSDPLGEGLTLYADPSTRQVVAWDTAYSNEFAQNVFETPVNSLPVMNTYFHWAFSVENGIARIFIDGQLHGEKPFNAVPTNSTGIRLGSNRVLARDFSGWCDSVRLTVGSPRYTAAFTPLTRRFEQVGVPHITLSSLVTPSIETNTVSELITVTANLINTEIRVYPYAETGMDFSQNELILTPASPSATFTVTATIAGNYLIGVETNVDPYIALPTELALEVTQGAILASYTVTNTETDPSMPGMFSAPYVISLVNPEDTITVGIILPPELFSNTNYITLGPGVTTDTFTVSGNTIGTYAISFIGNNGAVNPPDIIHEVAITPSIFITGYYNQFMDWNDVPYDLVTNNRTAVYQVYDKIYDSSGGASEMPLTYPITLNFTLPPGVSVEWDYGEPIVGPLVLGSSDDVFGFRFVFTTEGSKHIVIENDQGLPWLYGISNTNITEQIKTGTIELDYHLGPLGTVLLDEPVVALELNQESGVYTISAPDWNSVVDITISTSIAATVTIDAGHLVSGNVLRLANSADVATFTITPLAQGYLAISITNNKQLDNPAISYNDIYTGVKPSLSIVPPGFNNFYTGEITNDYTVILNDPVADVLISSVELQSLSVNFGDYSSSKVLTVAQPQAIFNLNYGDVGTGLSFVLTNDSNLNTPSITFDADYDQAEIAIVGTPNLSIERDQWSEYITVTATNLVRDYTCTIRIVGVNTGLAYDNDNFVLTPAQPSAQFRVLSSQAGNRTINIDAVPTNYPNSQRQISLVSNLAFSFSLPAGSPVYTVTEPADTETMVEFQSKTYTVQLEDPSKSFTVSITVDGVTNGYASPASFLLNSTNLTRTFTVRASSTEIGTINFTNNGGFDNPAPLTHSFVKTPSVYIEGVYNANLNASNQPFNTTTRNATPYFTIYDYYEYLTTAIDYPFPLTLSIDLPLGCVAYNGNTGKEFTEKAYVNSVYDYFNFRFYVPGANVITLSLDKSIPWQSGIGSINSGEVLSPDLVLTYNVTGEPAPFIYVTPVNGTNVQQNSAPATFTVSMLAPAAETTITIASWGTSGINTTTVVLSPGTLSADFTIAPSATGNFNLTFTNNQGLRNPPVIPIVVIPAAALSLIRNQSDTVGREEEETFTVTLSNPYGDVEVTPSVHADVTVGGYTPPLILNSTTPTGTFTVKSNVPALYDIGITNNGNIPNPAVVQMQVVNGSLSLTSAGGYFHETNADSLDFTVTLVDYDLPTIVTIDITNFVDGTLTINPTVSYSANQMLLDSTNRIGTFKIKKPVDSQVSITITNNTSLTNPATEVHNFVAFSGGSLFIQEEDMSLNMSAPIDASTELNIFQTIV